MFGKQDKKPDLEWFDLDAMARIFDVTPQAFGKTVRPLIPDSDIKNAGERGKVRIRARGAIDAWVSHKVTAAVAKGADPMLVGGGDSPALEEYRRHKSRLAEMDVQEREKSHADLTQLDTALASFANILRRSVEALQRRFGNDAAGIINDALDEAARQWQDTRGGSET